MIIAKGVLGEKLDQVVEFLKNPALGLVLL